VERFSASCAIRTPSRSDGAPVGVFEHFTGALAHLGRTDRAYVELGQVNGEPVQAPGVTGSPGEGDQGCARGAGRGVISRMGCPRRSCG
jgi:hypothetical protein